MHVGFQLKASEYIMQTALFISLCFCSSVPSFSEEGCQQTADYATEEETLQESNHPGLQNFGCGGYQYG